MESALKSHRHLQVGLGQDGGTNDTCDMFNTMRNPASCISCSGMIPDPRRMLLSGLWTTRTSTIAPNSPSPTVGSIVSMRAASLINHSVALDPLSPASVIGVNSANGRAAESTNLVIVFLLCLGVDGNDVSCGL